MIPKRIHWCWLSGEQLPDNIVKCIQSWKEKLPDYEIKCWTTENFDVNSVEYVRSAFEQKKWAFCSDYIRAYALFHEGGIYLDSDVQVLRSFDSYLNNRFVTCLEYHKDIVDAEHITDRLDEVGKRKKEFEYVHGIGLQAAVLMSEKGHPFLKRCLDFYNNTEFNLSNHTSNSVLIAPNIYALIAEEYGFVYKNIYQELNEGIVIYPSHLIENPKNISDNTIALHLAAHSWYTPSTSQLIYEYFSRIKILKKIKVFFENLPATRHVILRIKKIIWMK